MIAWFLRWWRRWPRIDWRLHTPPHVYIPHVPDVGGMSEEDE